MKIQEKSKLTFVIVLAFLGVIVINVSYAGWQCFVENNNDALECPPGGCTAFVGNAEACCIGGVWLWCTEGSRTISNQTFLLGSCTNCVCYAPPAVCTGGYSIGSAPGSNSYLTCTDPSGTYPK